MTEIPQIDIVVPVKNEEHDLAPSVARLIGYLRDAFPFTARVTIADNGSTDSTWLVVEHEIHYYVGQSGNSFGGGSGSSAITSWVAAHFKSQTVGGVTVYDL